MEKSPFLDEILTLLMQSSEFKLEELIADLELFVEFVITQSDLLHQISETVSNRCAILNYKM